MPQFPHDEMDIRVAAEDMQIREPDPGDLLREEQRQLYDAEHVRLARFVRRRVNINDDVEEIVQECWGTVFRRWHRFEQPANVLYVIAKNMIIDWYRQKPTQPIAFGDDLITVYEREQLRRTWSQATDPGVLVPARVDFERALNGLTPRQRHVLQLRYADDLLYAQIAAVLDISAETVKSTLADARASLRRSPLLAGYELGRAMTAEVRW